MIFDYILIFISTSGFVYFILNILSIPSGVRRLNTILDKPSHSSVNTISVENPMVFRLLLSVGFLKDEHFYGSGIISQPAKQLFGIAILTWYALLAMLSIFLLWTNYQENYIRLYLFLIITTICGLYLPAFCLRYLKNRRTKNIVDAMPDFIDLMIICTEAGLGFEAAIDRVSREIKAVYPVFSEEIAIINREIHAGYDKETALTNMMYRVKIDAFDRFVSIFLQSSKFGTSISESLKTLASMQRTNHLLEVEEKAARIPVLILLPMVLCIFPSIFIVIVGPALIQISTIFAH